MSTQDIAKEEAWRAAMYQIASRHGTQRLPAFKEAMKEWQQAGENDRTLVSPLGHIEAEAIGLLSLLATELNFALQTSMRRMDTAAMAYFAENLCRLEQIMSLMAKLQLP